MNSKIEKPTKEQLKAQSYDRHLTVTANAGTGKTRVLVHRYLNILLGVDLLKTDIEPQEVVAITFTRKAASEMLAKIAQNIEEKLKTCENKILSQRLEYIRENLIYANISTIHSFCSKLLRDYPIEAGINPAFVELSEPEKLSFQDQAITEVFEDWLETELDEKRVTFKNLLDILPEYKLRNLLKLIFNKRAITQNLIKLYSKSNSEILEKRDEYLKNLVVPTIVESINKLFNFFDKYNTDNLKAGNAKKLEEAFEHLKDFKVQLNSKSKAYSLPELIDKTLSIINEFFTQSFTIRKTYQNDENFTLETVIGNSASIIETFSKLLEVLKYESLDKELIQATRTVIDVYRDVEQSIKQRKDELGALDFDDFILLTYNLLRNEEVRRKVAKNLKYLLVDEFQDTDDFQYSIMKNLIGDFSGIEQNNNLFIVGDAKQSIYGFRNADVRIFNKARAEVREINRKKLEQQKLNDYFLSAEEQIAAESDAEREGELQLTATFRMQPNICSFVNTVCSNIFADKSNNYDVEYSPLVCAKNAEEFFQSEDKSSFGTVSFLTSFEQKNEGITLNTSQLIEKKLKEIEEIEEENEEENREEQEAPFLEEAELVARYIKNAVESSSDIFIEEKGEKRKPKYNDFAVLSRTRSSFESLVFYCLKYEIPHILHSGSGFFNNQEIIDVYSFLSFLNNPNDDLAFASILKSPFFNLSDAYLFELISSSKTRTALWELFQIRMKNSMSNASFLEKRAFSVINNLISIAPNCSLSQLVNEILAQTDYWGTLENSPAAAQKRINIEKLLKFARNFQSRGFRTLNDFVEELDFLIENSLGENEPVTLSDEDAVNMMTIHASKGLEFPIVILFNTNKKPKNPDSFLLDDEFGLGFKIPTLNEKIIQDVDTPISFIIRQNNRLAEEAENKRVLYVALTRAKEHLVISANLYFIKDGISEPQGLLKLITSGLGINSNFYLESNSLCLNEKLRLLINNQIPEIEYEQKIEFIKEIPDVEKKNKATQSKNEENIFLLNQIESSIGNRMFSASKLMIYDLDSLKYAERYLLGLPDLEQDDFLYSCSTKEDGEEEIIGSRAGTLIHNTLESINFWLEPNGYMNETSFNETVDTVLENSNTQNPSKIRERIVREVKNIASTPLIQRFAENISNAKSELELTVPFQNDFLLGKIDLLITNQQQEYEIWDWKTNKVDGNDAMDFLKSHYEPQMKFYAYLISLLNSEQGQYKARLLFTRLAGVNAQDDDWAREYVWSKEELEEFGKELTEKIEKMEDDFY